MNSRTITFPASLEKYKISFRQNKPGRPSFGKREILDVPSELSFDLKHGRTTMSSSCFCYVRVQLSVMNCTHYTMDSRDRDELEKYVSQFSSSAEQISELQDVHVFQSRPCFTREVQYSVHGLHVDYVIGFT